VKEGQSRRYKGLDWVPKSSFGRRGGGARRKDWVTRSVGQGVRRRGRWLESQGGARVEEVGRSRSKIAKSLGAEGCHFGDRGATLGRRGCEKVKSRLWKR